MMFARYRPPVQRPQSRFKRYTSKIWKLCVGFKISCSLWMLLVFAFAVLYFRDNYLNIAVTPSLPSFLDPTTYIGSISSSSSTISYLNKLSLHSLAYGTCPYTNPTYPSIGPDQTFICPLNKKYRAGSVWYLQKDIMQNLENDADTDKMDEFFKKTERVRDILRNNTNTTNKNIELMFKTNDHLHVTYQYMSCQTENDIKTAKSNWPKIVNNDKHLNVLKRNGFNSWKDVELCFDQILCMNDNYHAAVSFNLYFDDKSQKMMKELIDATEESEQNEYDIDLSFHRNIDQQSFHITLASIKDINDYNSFDAKLLMDKMNKEIKKSSFPCIKMAKAPPFKNEWCFNSKQLQKTNTKFNWICTKIEGE